MVPEEGSSSVSSSPRHKFSQMSLPPGLGPPPMEMRSEERGLCLIHLLVACANHVASGNTENANVSLEYISHLASPNGDTMQRIAAYFAEALADRMLRAWPGIHKALNLTRIASLNEDIMARKLYFECCPFLKLSYVITNQAILEAMEGERVVHVVDLDSFEPIQWVSLLRALNTRPDGPPHLRITGIHERKEVLDQMGHRLNEEAEKLDIPFQFNPIVVSGLENLDFDSLRVKTGEAVAISSVLKLHSLLAAIDENKNNAPSITKNPDPVHLRRMLHVNPRDFLEKGIFAKSDPELSPVPVPLAAAPNMASFLSALLGLSPKLMVVTEQESSHNELNLMDRIMEALNFYAALFDCLESTMPIASLERQKIEKMLYGKDINDIISCEGFDRKKRYEKLEKWVPRLELAGFGKVHLSYHVMMQARMLLESYNYDGYKVKEENGCFLIFWQEQPLFSVSAWRFRQFS